MIRVEHLSKRFRSGRWSRRASLAVDGVSLHIAKGETLGLVGESGCGKSTLSRLIMKLAEADEGDIYFDGRRITGLGMKEMRPLRRQMQMIFQHPDSALNPRQTLLDSLLEPVRLHRTMDREAGMAKALGLLELVGLSSGILLRYPHQISGGQIQRIVIARALMLNPAFLVLDEPTSMLDVSVQAQVIELLRQVQQTFSMTYLFISHDLELVRCVSDRIAVMRSGQIVETGGSGQLMEDPQHPYTRKLVDAFRALRY
ncbi:ATP-binding cassette domain-containing protein [Paenibacillus doosanensis]|uniref:ATP-binding cassette domain-containing protein n=1 Tax=Paenibacillus doosanensis TaxID=1229154 RepID=UPI0021802B54|nr:ATP-binding cassette domain-containing protein [Paenibacillus doosanensis]MCS7464711.1 ATP-binding cassette domain-containing protein [Paenibacillus doosanensis]